MNPMMPQSAGGVDPQVPQQLPPEFMAALAQQLSGEPDAGPAPDASAFSSPTGEFTPEALAFFLLKLLGMSPEQAGPAIDAASRVNSPDATVDDFAAYDDSLGSAGAQAGLGGGQLSPQLLARLLQLVPEAAESSLPPSPQSYGA